MFLPPTSRRNAYYRPAISLARFGIRPACRRTNGSSTVGLKRHMHYCVRADSRSPRLRARVALPIKATSQRPIRAVVVSARALGGDNRKLHRTHKKAGARLVRSDTSCSFRFDETKDVSFAQERLGLAR